MPIFSRDGGVAKQPGTSDTQAKLLRLVRVRVASVRARKNDGRVLCNQPQGGALVRKVSALLVLRNIDIASERDAVRSIFIVRSPIVRIGLRAP